MTRRSGRAQALRRAADVWGMRALLEFLGILEPDRGRPAPTALPGWLRGAVPAVVALLVVVTAALSYAAWTALRVLLP